MQAGASSLADFNDAVKAFYYDGSCTSGGSAVILAETFAHVNLDLPAAVSIALTADSLKVATASDPAAQPPISTPTAVTLTVTVTYADGSTADLSLDSRVVFLEDSSVLVVVNNKVLAVAGAGAGAGTVTVTYADRTNGVLTASVAVTVVAVTTTAISTNPYPAFTGSTSVSETTLSKVHCTDVYQRVAAALSVTLSTGESFDVTSYAAFAVAAANSFTSASNLYVQGNVLAPVGSGEFILTGAFPAGGTAFATTAIIVEDEFVNVVDITQTTAWTVSGTTESLVGVSGTTIALVVKVRRCRCCGPRARRSLCGGVGAIRVGGRDAGRRVGPRIARRLQGSCEAPLEAHETVAADRAPRRFGSRDSRRELSRSRVSTPRSGPPLSLALVDRLRSAPFRTATTP